MAEKDNKDQNMVEELFNMWKSSWGNYMSSVSVMQEQGDRMMEMLFNQSESIQSESKKLIKEWMANAKEAQKAHLNQTEEYLNKIEELIVRK